MSPGLPHRARSCPAPISRGCPFLAFAKNMAFLAFAHATCQVSVRFQRETLGALVLGAGAASPRANTPLPAGGARNSGHVFRGATGLSTITLISTSVLNRFGPGSLLAALPLPHPGLSAPAGTRQREEPSAELWHRAHPREHPHPTGTRAPLLPEATPCGFVCLFAQHRLGGGRREAERWKRRGGGVRIHLEAS